MVPSMDLKTRMRVLILKEINTGDEKLRMRRGEVHNLPLLRAKALIAAGAAVPVEHKAESAVDNPVAQQQMERIANPNVKR